MQDHGDGDPGLWPLRVRFAYWASDGLGFTTNGFASFEVKAYTQEGAWMSSETAYICPEWAMGRPDTEHCDPLLDWPSYTNSEGVLAEAATRVTAS